MGKLTMIKGQVLLAVAILGGLLLEQSMNDEHFAKAAEQSPGTAAPKISFSDTSGHWAKDNIQKAVELGFVDGYPDGSFQPERSVSRAEFIKMAVDAMKLSKSAPAPGQPWYQPYLDAAVAKGIHRYDDFTQDINGPITRQEMTRLVVRATRPDLQKPEVSMDDKSFAYNAVKAGLVQGMDRGALALGEATTRAQSVTVIDRVLRVNKGDQLEMDKHALNLAELDLKKTNIFTVMPQFFGMDGKSKIDPDHPWDPDKMVVETPDGDFKGSVDQVVAIDMDDSDDPNRWMLGNVDELMWMVSPSLGGYPIKDFPQSYILLLNKHLDYNHNPEKYGYQVSEGFDGITSPDRNALKDGVLNDLRPVYKNIPGDLPAWIIPKRGFKLTRGNGLRLNVYAPVRSSTVNYKRSLIEVFVPETLGQ